MPIYRSVWPVAEHSLCFLRGSLYCARNFHLAHSRLPAFSILKAMTSLQKRKYRVLINDLISFKWKCIKQKKQGWLILKSRIYISFTNFSVGTAFLLEGLIYNDKVKLRRYNLKIIKNSVKYDAMITRENFNKKKVNVKNIWEQKIYINVTLLTFTFSY